LHNVEAIRIGVTMKMWLRIGNDSMTWIDCPVEQIRNVWQNALEEKLNSVPV
jgi:hypothetical protein